MGEADLILAARAEGVGSCCTPESNCFLPSGDRDTWAANAQAPCPPIFVHSPTGTIIEIDAVQQRTSYLMQTLKTIQRTRSWVRSWVGEQMQEVRREGGRISSLGSVAAAENAREHRTMLCGIWCFLPWSSHLTAGFQLQTATEQLRSIGRESTF